jgi:hypothetical protein
MLCECGEIKKIDDDEREENDERDRDIKVQQMINICSFIKALVFYRPILYSGLNVLFQCLPSFFNGVLYLETI